MPERPDRLCAASEHDTQEALEHLLPSDPAKVQCPQCRALLRAKLDREVPQTDWSWRPKP